jgi:hypothetical protein
VSSDCPPAITNLKRRTEKRAAEKKLVRREATNNEKIAAGFQTKFLMQVLIQRGAQYTFPRIPEIMSILRQGILK